MRNMVSLSGISSKIVHSNLCRLARCAAPCAPRPAHRSLRPTSCIQHTLTTPIYIWRCTASNVQERGSRGALECRSLGAGRGTLSY